MARNKKYYSFLRPDQMKMFLKRSKSSNYNNDSGDIEMGSVAPGGSGLKAMSTYGFRRYFSLQLRKRRKASCSKVVIEST